MQDCMNKAAVGEKAIACKLFLPTWSMCICSVHITSGRVVSTAHLLLCVSVQTIEWTLQN